MLAHVAIPYNLRWVRDMKVEIISRGHLGKEICKYNIVAEKEPFSCHKIFPL